MSLLRDLPRAARAIIGMHITSATPKKIPNAIHKVFSERGLGVCGVCDGVGCNVLVGAGLGRAAGAVTALASAEVVAN